MTKVGGLDDTIWIHAVGPDLETPRRRRRRRVVLVLWLVFLTLLVVYPTTAAVLSRRDYGTFAFWKVPNRINYCGRRYYDSGPTRGSPVVFESQDADKQAHWTFLSWTFSGRSIYADATPLHPPTQDVCTMALYIPLGGGSWETYSLSGGP